MIRVLLAEDQAMVRGALSALLSLEEDIEVVAEASRGDEVVSKALDTRPDVALLDIEMPGGDGLSAADDLRREFAFVPGDHPHHLRPQRLPQAGDGKRRGRISRQGRPLLGACLGPAPRR